jgi:hypothetical protein
MEISDQRTLEKTLLRVALGYTHTNVIPDEKGDISCLMPHTYHAGLMASAGGRGL